MENTRMTYQPLTAEQKAALKPDEIEQMIAELEAVLADLRIPVPQPYPKWITVHGQGVVVQSAEEEAQKQKAEKEADAKAEKDAHAHPAHHDAIKGADEPDAEASHSRRGSR
jgi:hypothetical protein